VTSGDLNDFALDKIDSSLKSNTNHKNKNAEQVAQKENRLPPLQNYLHLKKKETKTNYLHLEVAIELTIK